MSIGKSAESVVGSELAGYVIEALIGRGGMGAVYRAEEAGLGRKVALKVIAPELAQDERFRERFLRESRIAASLDHPHIVPIFKAGDEDGALFLAMRYVEGTDLAKLLADEEALDPSRTISLLEQVAEALDAAHEKGLVHRDVKPSNVLIAVAAGKEHCYLADFGLTKRTGSLSGASAPGDVVGTLEYVAPEQVTGEPTDSRADVYSLGCVLYECLTGTPPFPRATDVALLWAHVHEEPIAPSSARPELPRQVDAVLLRALAKEPGRRYRTAGELMAAARSSLGLVATTAPSRRLPRGALAAASALVLVGIAAALALTLRSGSGGLSSVSPNAVGLIDPTSNDLVGEVAVGPRPEGVAVGEGAVWVANFEGGTISQIDPETRRAVMIPAGDYPSDVAVGKKGGPSTSLGAGVVWLGLTELRTEAGPFAAPTGNAEFFVGKLSWIEPTSATQESATLEGLVCRRPAVSVAVGRRAVWFACDTYLARVDPGTGTPELVGFAAAPVDYPSAIRRDFSDVAFGLGSLWLANRVTNTVIEIDPTTRSYVREITVGRAPSAVAIGRGSLWVTSFEDDAVWRIEVTGRGEPVAPQQIPVGDGPVDIAVGEGGVWVANSLDGTVSRIDPSTNEVVATINVGNEPRRVAVGEGVVWVTVRGVVTSQAP
jgi:YVTN family beta-propeller protein